MKDFYVSMRVICKDNKLQYYVQYWYNTDLRADSFTDDIPVVRITNWLSNC